MTAAIAMPTTPGRALGTPPVPPTEARLATDQLQQVLAEMRRVIVGQDRVLDRVLVALLADGHCLLEGAPGLGKTLTVATLARLIPLLREQHAEHGMCVLNVVCAITT